MKPQKERIRGWIVIGKNCYGFYKHKKDAEASLLGTSANSIDYEILPATLIVQR